MKRSEMIEIMYEADMRISSNYSPKEVLSKILAAIEDTGVISVGGIKGNPIEGFYLKRGWEPEVEDRREART